MGLGGVPLCWVRSIKRRVDDSEDQIKEGKDAYNVSKKKIGELSKNLNKRALQVEFRNLKQSSEGEGFAIHPKNK